MSPYRPAQTGCQHPTSCDSAGAVHAWRAPSWEEIAPAEAKDKVEGQAAVNPSRGEALFQLAMERPAEKHAAFLDAMGDGDAALRARLKARLADTETKP